METNRSSFKNMLIKAVEYFPDRIDSVVRWVDDCLGGAQTIKCFHRRSLLAFLLPVPIYIFIIFGPSLAWNTDGGIACRGGFTAVLLIISALILQLIYFLQNRWRGMAWVQFDLVIALAFLTWVIASPESVQASPDLYRHYYILLALIALLVVVPVAAWLRQRQLFAPPAEDLIEFHKAFRAEQVATQGTPRQFNIWDVIGAYALAVLRKPLHVVAPVALAVLLASPEHLKFWAIITFIPSLMLFATSIYDPERDAFVRLFQHVFLSGGTLLVTLTIITLAVFRLAGVDYVTTVLDAGSKLTLLSYIISTYTLFWFYDFWVNQAILDLVIKVNGFTNESEIIQRHGGGRIAVITCSDSGKKKRRMFEPAAFLMRIAQTASEPMRESLQNKAKRAEQRFRIFATVCLLIFAGAPILFGVYLRYRDQAPGLTAAKKEERIYNLTERLMSSGSEPVIMLAASGGGTRAALYTTAVLHGLSRLGKINRLVLASGVSGGSVALAYFAIHRPSLISKGGNFWKEMSEALASPFIDDVLAGAAEYRIVSEYRLGQLLTESFERRFLDTALTEQAKKRTTFGEIDDIGLIFNTSLCGSQAANDSPGNAASTARIVGRLVITNISSRFDRKPAAEGCTWGLDLPYEIVKDPDVSLFEAASLSANFPPVFSNAAVDVDGKRFWVTDGGAIENRGVISILLVLNETFETILADKKDTDKALELADIQIIVADASAFQPDYKSDRGLGAKFGASEQIANRLIGELITRAEQLHKSISGRENGIRIIYLPMPDAMRAAGTFGTHWMMPSTVTIKNPLSDKEGIELKSRELKELMDAMFSKEYSISYIEGRWPELDAKRIIEETNSQWGNLEACLK